MTAEQAKHVEPPTPWWIWVFLAVAAIVVIVLLWRYLLLAFIFIGIWPIARIFWGGLGFWARH